MLRNVVQPYSVAQSAQMTGITQYCAKQFIAQKQQNKMLRNQIVLRNVAQPHGVAQYCAIQFIAQ